jgi:hypothetical protein
MRSLIRVALLSAVMLGGAARAHEGGTHARGVVREVAKDRLVLQVGEAKPVTFAIVPETKIDRSGKAVPWSDVQVGERAVVHARDAKGRLEATDVKLGAAPRS